MNRIFSLFLAGLLLLNSTSKAQQVEQGFEMMEVMNIFDIYTSMSNLSFDISYTYADSAAPATILEQINGAAKMRYARIWFFLDSVEFIQGYQNGLIVDYRDSSITVSNAILDRAIGHPPITDSLFQAANVRSRNITVANSTTRVLTMEFNPNSMYSKYKMYYDPVSYYIKKIEYYLKDVPVDNEGVTSGTAIITMTLSNYSQSVVDQSIYAEDKFIYKRDGQYYTRPEYAGFRLINGTN